MAGFCQGIEAELCRVAEAYARLESENSDGTTRRRFLQRVSSMEDLREELEADQVSDRASYLWEHFVEIKAASGNGMTNAITWTVLADWSEIMHVTLEPWESRLIVTMDNIVRSTTEELKPKPPKKEK